MSLFDERTAETIKRKTAATMPQSRTVRFMAEFYRSASGTSRRARRLGQASHPNTTTPARGPFTVPPAASAARFRRGGQREIILGARAGCSSPRRSIVNPAFTIPSWKAR